jgi:ABC-type multidrug transport system fused ATPase/permease subunit
MWFAKRSFTIYEKAQPVLRVFSKKDRKIFGIIIVAQGFTAFLDLFGIFFVGIVGALVVSYLVSSNLPAVVLDFLKLFGLESYSTKFLIFIFSLLTLVFFISKTFFSIFINRKVLIHYGKMQTEFSTMLYRKLLNSSYGWLKKQNSDRIYTAIVDGSHAIFIKIVGNSIMIISDTMLLFFVLIFLIFFNPTISFFTFIFFLSISIILQKIIGKKANNYGRSYTENLMDSSNLLTIASSSFKEILVMNKKDYFVDKFRNSDSLKSLATAKALWIQQVPKYIFEIALAIGIFLLSFFLLIESVNNISVLMIFIVASGRLVPAIFRIQSGILGINVAYSSALVAVNFADELQVRDDCVARNLQDQLINAPGIEIDSLFYKFPDSNSFLLQNITIDIDAGEIVAFVGQSGSGKTTLVDLILNIYRPSKGRIVVRDGLNDITAGKINGIGYVPQHPLILKGSIVENIAFGINNEDVDLHALNYAISHANLDGLIKKLPDGVDTELSNLGGILSGGEKQRIALARALYLKPKLLVIDEGTSALDYTSEKSITESLMSLQGDVTIIVVAHRITTIKNIDKIYFLDDGKVIGSGNYLTLQKKVPEFANWVDSVDSQKTHS